MLLVTCSRVHAIEDLTVGFGMEKTIKQTPEKQALLTQPMNYQVVFIMISLLYGSWNSIGIVYCVS